MPVIQTCKAKGACDLHSTVQIEVSQNILKAASLKERQNVVVWMMGILKMPKFIADLHL